MLLALCSYVLRKNGCDYDAQQLLARRFRLYPPAEFETQLNPKKFSNFNIPTVSD